MQRQRGELIHIGEVFGGLDGTVQATRDASPQAALTRAACPPMGVCPSWETDDMNVKKSAIRERLVKRGKKLVKELNGLELSKPKDLSETQYQEAGKLVDVRESDHPHAFVIACIMDRLIKAERAWFNPYRLSRRIGNLDFCTLLKLSEDEIQDHMKGPPALHRFPRQNEPVHPRRAPPHSR